MACLIILVILAAATSVSTNKLEEDENPFAEAAAAILKEQGAENIGSLVNNLVQSGGAKQIGDMLLNAAGSENAGQILQGLGSLLGQGQQQRGGGFDPSILGAVANLLQATNTNNKKKSEDSFDFASLLSTVSAFMGQPGSSKSLLDYLPMVLQTVNAFVGPEAEARQNSHSDHSWLLPPVLEKIHVMFDHFMHSDISKHIINTLGAEKFVKIFLDDKGDFDYKKFADMMENQSFRRHWIKMVTNRMITFLSFLGEPQIQKEYQEIGEGFVNGILKAQGYPKSTYFDPARPVESISALVNYVAKSILEMKIDAKQYVKPAVAYVRDALTMAQSRGKLLNSGETNTLSDKLADTINLEVIEPIARVNRAYRFAKKVPKCDRYVMCLVNQDVRDDNASLPGLKPFLSKSSSLILSWFLSSDTGTSFWSLYNVIMENKNCKTRYFPACNDFHIEEVKVTTEYVHNEL